MGTRNMTMVIDQEGAKKVAQYGQWDGYPSGVGADILNFLKNTELFEKFKAKLGRVRFAEPEGKDKELLESYDNNAPTWSNDPDKRTEEQKKWFKTFITRDLAAEVLTNIAESEREEIILMDREELGKMDGAGVEWSYIIDLQKGTLAVHGTIDTPPIKVYELDKLPTNEDFINEFKSED